VGRCGRMALPLPSNWCISWLREPHRAGHHQTASANQHQAHENDLPDS
jgi:hypothetical protein